MLIATLASGIVAKDLSTSPLNAAGAFVFFGATTLYFVQLRREAGTDGGAIADEGGALPRSASSLPAPTEKTPLRAAPGSTWLANSR